MSVPDVKLILGEKVADKFVVKKKIGEGSCGQVYLVTDTRNDNTLAMKVEPRMKLKDEEILKMEIYVLKKLQTSKHVCRFVQSGLNAQFRQGRVLAPRQRTFSYVIMTLLGQELSECRRLCPKRKMSASSTIRIAIQAVTAVEDMHNTGFIHRDIKPTNLALGHKQKHVVYMFDFGLARQIMIPDKAGKMTLREPRKKVSFRGTVRYCSLNVHQAKEQGRHDDLWCVLHTLVELVTGTLPWKGAGRKEAERLKASTSEKALLKGCPPPLAFLYKTLQSCTYTTLPPYTDIKKSFADEIKKQKVKMTAPFEWETSGGPAGKKAGDKSIAKDVGREIDKACSGGDNDTSKDVNEDAVSATTEASNTDSVNECDVENTLENIADIGNSSRDAPK